MRKNRIVFELNIPFDLTIDKRNDIIVLCSSKKSELLDYFPVEFLDIDTTLMIRVTDWMKVYKMAQQLAKKEWEARENAKPIVDLEVTENGELIYKELN